MKPLFALVACFAAVLASCRSVPERTAPFSSDRIEVTVHGKGPDVLLVAGAGANAAEVWRGTIERLPDVRFHVVQVAGFAGAPARANGGGAVVEPVAEEVARYVKTARLQRPALVGLSMGGTVGLLVAARHPDALSRLMVVDMVPFMGTFYGPPGRVADSAAARPIADKVQAGMLAETAESRRARTEALVAKMARSERERPRLVENGLASDPAVMARVMHEMIVLDLRSELPRIAIPTKVLYVHAPLIPLDAAQTDAVYADAYARLPQAQLERVDDAYHFVMLDQPARFAAELQEFLGR